VIAKQSREGWFKAVFLQDCSQEPPRRFAPPLLTQEGNSILTFYENVEIRSSTEIYDH
jgi:hypothetical protein